MSHSVLPPSSIKRVIRCPASAKINAEADRKSNIAAARGTQIHEMVEMRLKNRLDGITLSEYWLDKNVKLMVLILQLPKMTSKWLTLMLTMFPKEEKN